MARGKRLANERRAGRSGLLAQARRWRGKKGRGLKKPAQATAAPHVAALDFRAKMDISLVIAPRWLNLPVSFSSFYFLATG